VLKRWFEIPRTEYSAMQILPATMYPYSKIRFDWNNGVAERERAAEEKRAAEEAAKAIEEQKAEKKRKLAKLEEERQAAKDAAAQKFAGFSSFLTSFDSYNARFVCSD
jgi:hypothetical protein